MERANWLQRVQLQKQWQTARMAELEKQVEHLLAVNATQAVTIEALRARVRAGLEPLSLTLPALPPSLSRSSLVWLGLGLGVVRLRVRYG